MPIVENCLYWAYLFNIYAKQMHKPIHMYARPQINTHQDPVWNANRSLDVCVKVNNVGNDAALKFQLCTDSFRPFPGSGPTSKTMSA